MRISNDIQQDEVHAYEQFCARHNVILDATADAIANANLVREYFLNTWKETITEANLEKALPQLRPHLKFKSKARLEFEKLASQEPDRANQLVAWLDSQKQLVNSDSDATYENLTLLLTTLRGYDIIPARIRDAENRITNRPGRKLHYVPIPRKEMGTITEAARNDDGRPFLGDLVKNPDGSWRSKTVAEQRHDMEAAENAQKQTQTATSLSSSDQQWKSMSVEACHYGTHSDQAQIRQVYDKHVGVGAPWREVYEAVNSVRSALKRRREQMPA